MKKDLRNLLSSEAIQERIKQKKIAHDVKKVMKGFCDNPFCLFCHA